MKRFQLCLLAVLLSPPALHADLIHRYSFTNGVTKAVDSIGNQDGTLVGNASITSNAVKLNGNGGFVSLPRGLLTGLQSMTIECWFTYTNNGAWARVFDFGGTNPSSGSGRNYIFYTPQSSSGTSRLVISDADPGYNHEEIIDYTVPAEGVQTYIACVYNGSAKTMSLYVNGTLAKSISVTIPLSAVDGTLAYLGKSLYNDPYLLGSINEFRIFDNALTDDEIRSNYGKGPNSALALLAASRPSPANGATDVQPGTVFSWVAPALEPDSYTVFVSDNPQFTDAQVMEVSDPNCTPVLAYGTTYYWYVVCYYGSQEFPSSVWTLTTEAISSILSPVPALNVVINEIHYHADNNTEPVEFIELYNAFTEPVDVSGWYFANGVSYVFPEGTLIAAKGYLVVSQNPTACATRFGVLTMGPFEGKLSNDGENLMLRNRAGEVIDSVNYGSDFPWPTAANGEGASMELIHPSLDNDLAGSWRSSGYHADRPESAFGTPTPGRRNSVYSGSAPPQIRKVMHSPEAPVSGAEVRVTARVTDPDGVRRVRLKVQVVTPGNYIPAYLPISISSLISNPDQSQPLNPAFEAAANWEELPMTDDGTGQDDIAGDRVYTAVIPGMTNRTLVRYRIVAEDETGRSIQVPYADDPSLNFAYYVYDGVPDYAASQDSVSGAGHVYPSSVLTSIPVYTLITRSADLYQCSGYNSADQINQSTSATNNQVAGRAYNWEGAFVYEGKVYDHVGYRLRGGNGRYSYNSVTGKRAMKFRFNRGNYFQARDIYGNLFPSKWENLNVGKMFGNRIGSGYRRYPYGINEIMDARLFEAYGVPAPQTWWMHFRVVDGTEEAPTGSNGQYLGDFWGLYLAFENYDGAFLDRLGLPEGNLYKLSDKVYDGPTQLRYQGPNAVDDSSDYENIRWNLTYAASVDFIREYLDCDEWYRYHTVTEAIRHYDIFAGATCTHCLKNCAWYFYPSYSPTNPFGKLQWLPFDVDDTWGPFYNKGIDHARAAIYDWTYDSESGPGIMTVQPAKAVLKQEYRNVIREFRDLQWQPDVINGMIDELAAFIADFVPADRDRWRLDYTVPGSPCDNGTLEECVALMKQFAWKSGSFQGGYYWVGSSNNLDTLANDEGDLTNLPATPAISYVGTAGYPVNDLRFETSAFSDPQGSGTFAAMRWRIAEYDLNYTPPASTDTGSDAGTVLLAQNGQWKYFRGTEEPNAAWRQPGFDDSAWRVGQTPIGYGDPEIKTDLSRLTPPMRNNYTTVYLRNTFQISDKSQIQSLALHVFVDDGCIIWINGTEVTRLYCSAGEKAYNALTGTTYHEAGGYEDVVLPAPYSYLVDGTNVIAIQVIQNAITSSDLSIDVSVSELIQTAPAPKPTLGPSKYELQAVWQSDELTDPGNRQIQIPADRIEPGKTYRVRSRMKDNTGRWSHWSAPVEFVAGPATN
jgi:hypothetical protein